MLGAKEDLCGGYSPAKQHGCGKPDCETMHGGISISIEGLNFNLHDCLKIANRMALLIPTPVMIIHVDVGNRAPKGHQPSGVPETAQQELSLTGDLDSLLTLARCCC